MGGYLVLYLSQWSAFEACVKPEVGFLTLHKSAGQRMSVNPALRMWREENQKFKVILAYKGKGKKGKGREQGGDGGGEQTLIAPAG